MAKTFKEIQEDSEPLSDTQKIYRMHYEIQDNDLFTEMQKMYVIRYGIKVVSPGIYTTACGKGFWECRENEPEEIEIKYPGIEFFEYDAGFREFYYWDIEKMQFVSEQVGD